MHSFPWFPRVSFYSSDYTLGLPADAAGRGWWQNEPRLLVGLHRTNCLLRFPRPCRVPANLNCLQFDQHGCGKCISDQA